MTTDARPTADPRILCPVLIGRNAEMSRLETLLLECVGGRGRTALVSGEAGVGKSAATRDFVQRARGLGVRAFTGECTEIDARRPFGPFMDIARAADRQVAAQSELAIRSGGRETPGVTPFVPQGTVPPEARPGSTIAPAAPAAPPAAPASPAAIPAPFVPKIPREGETPVRAPVSYDAPARSVQTYPSMPAPTFAPTPAVPETPKPHR